MNQSGKKNQNKKVRDIDMVVEEIQNQIVEDEKTIFSKKVIELYKNPLNFGMMEDADVFATINGWCGDTMMIYLRVKEGIIEDTSFYTDGCGATLSAGSMLATMAKGKTIKEARKISEKDLLDALGGLPAENLHCAALSVNTLRKAIGDFMKNAGHAILEKKNEKGQTKTDREEDI